MDAFWQDVNRRKGFILLPCLGMTLLLWALHAVAAQPTLRQKEILTQLESLHPPWFESKSGWMLDAWNAEAGLEELVALPAGGGNAATRFRDMEALFPVEKTDLETDGSGTRGVEALLEAADMAECRMVPEIYPEFDTLEAKQPELLVLQSYLRGLLRRGEKARLRGDAAEAERCYRAALVCGRHLTRDKSSSLVYAAGLTYGIRGAREYSKYLTLTGDAAKSEAVKQYMERQTYLMRAYLWKANTALSEFDGFSCLPAVVRIATGDKEVFWRKHAVGSLATLRYGVPDPSFSVVSRHPEFEKIADETLAVVAARDPDPSVRRLARWAARNVRPGKYAKMEHRFDP